MNKYLVSPMLMLLVLVCVNSWAAKEDPKKKTEALARQKFVHFLNSYSTVGELVDDYEKFGFVFPAEKKRILEKLNKAKVPPATKLPGFKVEGETIMAGKFGWTVTENGQIKCVPSGGIVNVKNGTVVAVFEKAFEVCAHKPYAANFFVPAAYAEESADDATVGYLALALEHVLRAVEGDFLVPISATAAGMTGVLVDRLYWPIHAFLSKGVTCDDGKYVLNLGTYPDATLSKYDKAFSKDICERGAKTHALVDANFSGHFQAICDFSMRAGNYLMNVLERTTNKTYISSWQLKQTLGPDADKPCNTKSAAAVGRAIREEISKMTPTDLGKDFPGSGSKGTN